MNEKFKIYFLLTISLRFFDFYNCFLLCCAQRCHFFCISKCSTEAPENHFVRGDVEMKKGTAFIKKVSFFKKKFYRVVFTEFIFRIATVFSAKNLVATKNQSFHLQSVCKIFIFVQI